ncbi:phorbol-12-myristate-13-acetate-induced protein 1 [Clupea harengus]|uniref:Phorbol-12-myristate-13-acetate-induced protein 1 n=1 Tax=Clupea harengus TaxID=7950 RepID=A0A8M1KUP7_CLUHA|nr:phorbol-12-myristate-13-acetate-induced protein 1 [Clupea harengus]
MSKKEETAVLECARQLRKMGDLLDWKYKLLDILLRNYNQAAKFK